MCITVSVTKALDTERKVPCDFHASWDLGTCTTDTVSYAAPMPGHVTATCSHQLLSQPPRNASMETPNQDAGSDSQLKLTEDAS